MSAQPSRSWPRATAEGSQAPPRRPRILASASSTVPGKGATLPDVWEVDTPEADLMGIVDSQAPNALPHDHPQGASLPALMHMPPSPPLSPARHHSLSIPCEWAGADPARGPAREGVGEAERCG
eukprot:CAMPEP_0197879608 /NCGR_PEP_ID=MMETSP1439-20131203/7653_1 /TAXON_ID=66791 /ORGANISM="Gonyaulax spinifera, Strain CCMP409" /LENGTH=123 /DNA_ID=CAMNT_0043499125 /DNA_START=549 /DNA_END=920 /DNA_ORIENTATION=+